jgi:hypothetical protein
VHLIYVVADPTIIEQRLQARIQRPESVAAEGKFLITSEHFARIVSYLEPPTPDEKVIMLDTSRGCLDEQLNYLNQQLQYNFLGR